MSSSVDVRFRFDTSPHNNFFIHSSSGIYGYQTCVVMLGQNWIL